MIKKVRIKNFKSIQTLELDLGRVNVFIGENGCGKSNILEAIALSAASSQKKLDNEFLASRGIRVTEPQFMVASFGATNPEKDPIEVTITQADGSTTEHVIASRMGDLASPQWYDIGLKEQELKHIDHAIQGRVKLIEDWDDLNRRMQVALEEGNRSMLEQRYHEERHNLEQRRIDLEKLASIPPWNPFDFYIYSPENSALRTFQAEGQILPLGMRGEGLFAFLKRLSTSTHRHVLEEISKHLSLIDWFERFEVPTNLAPFERSIAIVDRHLTEGARFDQRSANEGFLFLLFYFTLFISPGTPKVFAIDNVDASLNPKLCAELTRQLVMLAAQHDKQVIFTTHNPAVLDGLDLHDDEQRLFVISRNQHGQTRSRRISPPKPLGDDLPLKLSEAFLRGHLGGLPKNF